jgi:hypothetical protein
MKPLRLNKKKIACAILAGTGALFYACILPVGNGAGLSSSGELPVYDTTLSIMVQPIFTKNNCIQCHVAPSGTGYLGDVPLDLTSGNSYASLVNVATYQEPDKSPHFRVRVDSSTTLPVGVPYSIGPSGIYRYGNADSSYLYQKLLASYSPWKGSPSVQMPQGYGALSEDDLKIIKRWIEKGAPQ